MGTATAEDILEDLQEDKKVNVTLVWGGTGESKHGEVSTADTAGIVFDMIYQRFHQTKSPEDTFEVNEKKFPRSEFGETIRVLIQKFGEHLVFEIIPPTSGACDGAH